MRSLATSPAPITIRTNRPGNKPFRGAIAGAALFLASVGTVLVPARASHADTDIDAGAILQLVAAAQTFEAYATVYDLVGFIADIQVQITLRDVLLLKIWREGGNPWLLDPNWVPPAGA